QNDLLCGEGGMISAEPAARVREMAQSAAGQPELVAALCDASLPAIERLLDQPTQFRAQYRAYLEKFGDRCMEELKLESATLHDDPSLLFRSVGEMARRFNEGAGPAATTREADRRRAAEERVRQALRYHPLRRRLFAWVLKNARAR